MKKTELEATTNTRIDELKSESVSSLGMKISTLNSNKPYSSYDQPSVDLIKWPLLKSLEKSSHASQFTKHISSMTLEGDTLLQIQKWWYAIPSSFCQYLSTNKRWKV